MQTDKRSFIIFSKYRRLQRLWQFFFTGWVLVMIASLVAAAILTKQLLWTPISAINMADIAANQFKMTNAAFTGTDKNGNPFDLNVAVGIQKYGDPDTVFLERVSGTVVQKQDNKYIKNKIQAQRGRYNIPQKIITLMGDVRVDSDTGDKIRTNQLVIRL